MPVIRLSLRDSLLGSCVFLMTLPALAADIYVPPDLEPWRQWVLHGQENIACPIEKTQRACVWPGRLELDIKDSGGAFSQSVQTFAEGWFQLPRTATGWPQDVTRNGRPAIVTEQNGGPAIRLPAGRHNVAGLFDWTTVPQYVQLGSGTGLVRLSVNGEAKDRPRWTGNRIWLGQTGEVTGEQADNRIGISVYRTVFDGAPARIDVTLRVDVSGESREEVIGQLVPEGFVPADMTAPLPARLDPDGQLRIQARPGNWTFQFEARTPGPLQELVFEPRGEHWPREEIWSFAADPRLRVAEAAAANPIDPVQAGVPPQYQQLPGFRMQPGDRLTIVERQRGRAASERDRLVLARSLWLDFDRGGYTARDQITGTMVDNWRLDVAPPFDLKSGSLTRADGGTENLLVTQNPDDPQQLGVEIRTPQVNVLALSRLEEPGSTLPVAGWDARLDGVNTQLFLPPGYRLIHAGGADRANGSWLSQWNLLDFFLVLIVTVALWRMYGYWVGILALAALSLGLHETGAPVWTWLNVVIALALAKYLPTGRALDAARGYKLFSIALLAVFLLPFAAGQLKSAIFPQLELERGMGPGMYAMLSETRSIVSEARYEERSKAAAPAQASQNILNRYDNSARVQTGPGIPDWRWNDYSLSWSGPVTTAQTMRLWIAPPWTMALWRIAMVALMFGLIGALLRLDPIGLRRLPVSAVVIVPIVLFIGAIALLLGGSAVAQTPDAKLIEQPRGLNPAMAPTPDAWLLQQLRDRLTEAPECFPACVDISRAKVGYDAAALSVELIAHAEVAAAIPVPGSSNSWRPESVRVDGQAADALRLENDTYSLLLSKGVHRIQLRGAMPNSNTVALAFPLTPRYVEVSGDGWEVTGISDNRLPGSALTLIRQRGDRPGESLEAIDIEQFPAFVEISREISIDLDWIVTTTVRRKTPRTAAIDLRIPLLEGESVTSERFEIEDNHAVVNLATGQNATRWRSTLARLPQLTLRAETNRPWQEQWSVATGASWHLEHSGVPEIVANQSGESVLLQFVPWPGESLTLDISRPEAVSGLTLAIDAADLTENVGQRTTESELAFKYRATQGGQQIIRLPAGSELESVSTDGRPMSLTLEDGNLRLPLSPGEHGYSVSWRNEVGNELVHRGGRPDLGIAASNLHSTTMLAANRWIVWTSGPRVGPAVLYWSELAVFVLIAFILARIAKTPLGFRHWLLLGLGFSTFFWPAFAVVATAFLALAWRQNNVIQGKWVFNLGQLFLVGLVFAAGIALVTTIPFGLLGTPDMNVSGGARGAQSLTWFIDQTDGAFPVTTVVSLPLWVYKGLILVWALWLSFALLRWLPWIWKSFSHGGYWKTFKPDIADRPGPLTPST